MANGPGGLGKNIRQADIVAAAEVATLVHLLRPGEGLQKAETVPQPPFDLCLQGIVRGLADGHIFPLVANHRVRAGQLVSADGLARAECVEEARISVEWVVNQLGSGKGVNRTAGGIELRSVRRLPHVQARVVNVIAQQDVVREIQRTADFEQVVLELPLQMQAGLIDERAAAGVRVGEA